MPNKVLKVYSDGASSGNPGPSGIGYVIINEDGEIIRTHSEFIGQATNNIAEYIAFDRAIDEVLKIKPDKVYFFLDSELLVKQIKGEYKVKNKNIFNIFEKVVSKLSKLNYDIAHVRREENKLADKLAKDAVKYGLSRFTK